ncbi:unnamed protein product [Scytosiphon promiscuus]
MAAVIGGLLLLASATPSVAGSAVQGVQLGSAVNRMGSLDGGVGFARHLQSESCDEDTVFVDSLITDLGYPIGGCYEVAATSSNGFNFYSFGGEATVGATRIYVSDEGSWEIGMIEEVDEATGEATEVSMVCTTEPLQANAVALDGGPTSSQLDDAWQCTYFQDGVTNYLPGDFTGVECGCDGRTTVEVADDSDDGVLDTTAIAISALAALAVLAVFVCGCFIRLKQRKAQKNNMEAPKEDYAFST